MSQGKAWKKDEVFKILEPLFKLGCNVTKACAYAGIPRTTVQTWIEEDEELRLKIEVWQNELNLSARKTLAKALQEESASVSTAFDWLRVKEKDEFTQRTELTGADGSNLLPEKTDKDMADKALGSYIGPKHADIREEDIEIIQD